MDPGFYEDLAGRLFGLLIGLEDRLNCDDASAIHHFDARHYALALEEIARTVVHREVGITGQEHAGILALADGSVSKNYATNTAKVSILVERPAASEDPQGKGCW